MDSRLRLSSQRSSGNRASAVGGAIGGAILTLLGGMALSSFQAGQAREQRAIDVAAEQELQLKKERQIRVSALGDAYDDLGDTPRRAIEFIADGKEGGANDVRIMYRHFSRLISVVRSEGIPIEDVRRRYGENKLASWSARLDKVAAKNAVTSRLFSDAERRDFAVVAAGLQLLAGSEDVEQVTDMENATSSILDSAADAIASNGTGEAPN